MFAAGLQGEGTCRNYAPHLVQVEHLEQPDLLLLLTDIGPHPVPAHTQSFAPVLGVERPPVLIQLAQPSMQHPTRHSTWASFRVRFERLEQRSLSLARLLPIPASFGVGIGGSAHARPQQPPPRPALA